MKNIAKVSMLALSLVVAPAAVRAADASVPAPQAVAAVSKGWSKISLPKFSLPTSVSNAIDAVTPASTTGKVLLGTAVTAALAYLVYNYGQTAAAKVKEAAVFTKNTIVENPGKVTAAALAILVAWYFKWPSKVAALFAKSASSAPKTAPVPAPTPAIVPVKR